MVRSVQSPAPLGQTSRVESPGAAAAGPESDSRPAASVSLGRLLFAGLLLLLSATSCGERDRSNPLDPENPATGGTPPGFVAVALDGEVELRWTPLSLEDLVGMNLYRKEQDGGWLELQEGSPFPALSGVAVDTSVVNGVTYDYRLVPLIEGYGEGVPSPLLSATPGARFPVLSDVCSGIITRLSADSRTSVWRRSGFYFPLALGTTLNRVWVADFYSGLFCFSDDGSLVWVNRDFPMPVSVAVREDGVSAVADVGSGSVGIISGEGQTLLRIWDGLQTPVSTAFGPGGELWVADRLGGRVNKYSRDGVLLASFVGCSEPRWVSAGAPDGSCWVGDVGTGEVIKLDLRGRELFRLTFSSGISAMALDQERIGCWVADSEKGELARVSEEGVVTCRVGKLGNPVSIFVADDGRLFVTDLAGGKLFVLSQAGELLFVSAVSECPASVVVVSSG